jgi:hypothetical protein
MRRFLVIFSALLAGWLIQAPAWAQSDGFLESFATSPDRAIPLNKLTSGTEDYYYYKSLHYQHLGQLDKVDALLKEWRQRSAHYRLPEIERRQILLRYSATPKRTLDYLRKHFHLRFQHQQQRRGEKPALPTTLDPLSISHDALYQRAMQNYPALSHFTPHAYEWLAKMSLSDAMLAQLLDALPHPDIPDLPKLIVRDMKNNEVSFGRRSIHQKLLQSQLEALLKLMPSLRDDRNFIQAYLQRLQPTEETDLVHDLKARAAHIARLWKVINALKLGEVHRSLKVHLLYHWLVVEEKQGIYNRERFLEYLRYPRRVSYLPRAFRKRTSYDQKAALNEDFSQATRLPQIGADWPLLRRFFLHFFVKESSYKGFSTLVDQSYLKPLFAEAKLLAGKEPAQQWIKMISVGAYKNLLDRVDIDFAPTNPQRFAIDQPVELKMWIKNVNTLIVKVYHINAESFYRQNKAEVSTALNLDGLVANEEQTYRYEDAPIRRIERSFSFPKLKERGTYIVDFIGNGKSSRVLIRKGQLFFLERLGAAGHVFTVVDEQGRPAPSPRIWMDGREFTPDKEGKITIPFTNTPKTSTILLGSGGFISRGKFSHLREEYTLDMSFFLEREALIAGKQATLLMRPRLTIHQHTAALKLLQETSLTLTSTDRFGVQSTSKIDNLKLIAGREFTHTFRVPEQLSSLSFAFQAKVKNLSTGKEDTLSAGYSITANEIDRTQQLHALHLLPTQGGHYLLLLDRTGQPQPNRAVDLQLNHRDFTQSVHTSLRTDDKGRITLGDLKHITTLQVNFPGFSKTWSLNPTPHALPSWLHAKAGESITLAAPAQADAERSNVALFSIHKGLYLRDMHEMITYQDGLYKLDKLPVGEYLFVFKPTQQKTRIRVVAGQKQEGYLVSARHFVQHHNPPALQLLTALDDKALTITLKNATPKTRLHLVGTHFWPEFSLAASIPQRISPSLRSLSLTLPLSAYAVGRDIGDEYRYILDRKYAKKYPSNLLKRPSLLLNPWEVRSTQTGLQGSGFGSGFGGIGRGGGGGWGRGYREGRRTRGFVRGQIASLDFLPQNALLLANLTPNQDRQIVIPREKLNKYHYLQIVALDGRHSAATRIVLPEDTKAKYNDLTLQRPLNAKKHFGQQKHVALLQKGQSFEIADILSTEFAEFTSLQQIFALLQTLCRDSRLKEFEGLMRWPKMTDAQKQAFYGKHASHELHFFLYRRDKEFFQKIVKPYIANKYEKTFLDHWFLGHDLTRYQENWAYQQLNTFERILLAQRIPALRAQILKNLEDWIAQHPIDSQAWSRLFDTVLRLRSLSTDKTGLEDAQDQALAEEKKAAESTAIPMPSMAPAPPAAAPPMPRRYYKSKRRARRPAMKMEAPAEKAKGDRADDEADGDLARRDSTRQFFRQKEKTKEWAENNYYKRTQADTTPDIVRPSRFWLDVLRHDGKTPFLSSYFAESTRNATEAMLVLAFLELGWESAKPELDTKKRPRVLYKATAPTMLFHKQIQPLPAPKQASPLLVRMGYFDAAERYRYIKGQRVERYISGEFLTQKVYGIQTVITNPTAAYRKLEILIQIPKGAMPVNNDRATHTHLVQIGAYQTQRIDTFFYFPRVGSFSHFPVHVSQEGELQGFTQPETLKAVEQLSKIDRESWDYLSQEAPAAELLRYLEKTNLHRVDLNRIAWRMRDKAFFNKAIQILHARQQFNALLWSYGFYHNDASTIRTYLKHQSEFVNSLGSYLKSPLLDLDPVERKLYEHLEYKPLINARAHTLGKERKILNDRLRYQYQRLLRYLSYKASLDARDRIALIYYLLLQDRIEEALTHFAKLDPKTLDSRLQYDYLAAYLKFFSDKPEDARAIAMRYKAYPVPRWKKRFADVLAHLDAIAPTEKAPAQKTSTKTEGSPSLALKLEGRKLALRFAHVKKIQLRYYPMDIELLFSRSPFLQQLSGRFTVVKPAHTAEYTPKEGQESLSLDLPATFQNQNVMVEASADGLQQQVVSYANALDVKIFEQEGQLRVNHEQHRRPLARTYVKVYARLNNGQIQFYKDGYTDLRGRFDYASLSTDTLNQVQRFAILILSEKDGAVVREITPPRQ